MLARKPETLTNSFLRFSLEASNILHIKTEQDYQDALETIEHLFSKAKDTADDPLNDLIALVSKSIEKYEATQEAIIAFDEEANNTNQEISVLRVLMSQHHLTLADFKDEIGSKSLVSMILNGKRNLTKEHIAKISKRFNLDPASFFNLKAA
ncbi:MAG: helix-turn-helix domain-containing protein [Gammaproteobacteria bacterium]|nr:helix-turn-helix domain-containing protein [Gammaproteobacteria bacterium]